MGRSQVLYNRTAARMRASRGGRGRDGGGRGSRDRADQQQTARGGSPGRRQQQRTAPPPPQALPPEAEQELTKEQAAAAEERRREQEAEQMMLLSQATSQFVSQQRSVARDEEDHQGGGHFVRSTPSSETESLCSHMARALEFGLTRSDRLRMPAHLVETVYGREHQAVVAQRRPARPPSSPASPKNSAWSPAESKDSLAPRREAIASSAPPPSHPATLHVTESMEPVMEASSSTPTFDSGSVYSHPVAAPAAAQPLNSNKTASVEEKADDAVDALLSMNNEAEADDGEVDALLAAETSSTDCAPHPLNSAAGTTNSSVDAVDGNDFHDELNSAVSSEGTATADTHEDDQTMEAKAAGQRTGGGAAAAEVLRAAAASPPHYMEPTVSSVLKAHELPPKSPPSGDSMEHWLDDLLASGDTGDDDDAA